MGEYKFDGRGDSTRDAFPCLRESANFKLVGEIPLVAKILACVVFLFPCRTLIPFIFLDSHSEASSPQNKSFKVFQNASLVRIFVKTL